MAKLGRTRSQRRDGQNILSGVSSKAVAVGGIIALSSVLARPLAANAFEFKSEKNQASYEMEEERFGPYAFPNHHKIPNERGPYGESSSFKEAVQNCLEESPVHGLCYDQKYGAMKDWDVSEITDFSWAFSGYTHTIENNGEPTGRANFNANISAWRPVNAKRMDHMFYYAVDFNQDISKWGWRGGLAHKTPQPGMFQGAIEFQRRFNCPDAIEGPVHQCREVEGWKPQESYMRTDASSSGLSSSRESESEESSSSSSSYGSNSGGSGGGDLSKPRPMSGELGQTEISDEDVEAFLRAEDQNIPLSEILKMKKSLSKSYSPSQEELDDDDDELNREIENLKSKAKKYVTSSKSFDPSYEPRYEMPSKYKQNAATKNSYSSYASSFGGGLGESEVEETGRGSEDAETVKNSKFEAEKMLLMKQLSDLENKNKALESKAKGSSSSSDDDRVEEGEDVLKDVLDKKRAASSSSSSSSSASSASDDEKTSGDSSEFELLKAMKAKLDSEVQTLKSEIFNVKDSQQEEEDSQQEEEVSTVNEDGQKYLEEDTIRNAIGKCLQEAAIDGKCTKFGEESGYGEMPDWDVSHITNMEKLFYKKWHFNADLSKWDTSHVTNMKKMFYYAFEFSQDLSGWKGEAAESEQDNMFNGASRFQANFVCKDKETGPVKTCISLAASKGEVGKKEEEPKEEVEKEEEEEKKQEEEEVKPLVKTLVSEDEEEQAAEEAEAEMHKHDLVKLSDKTLRTAIAKCLKEDPVTGNCDKFAASSGYGVMPHWDTSEVTDMKKAFYKRADFDGDISQWNTGSVTNMMYMFFGAKNFDHFIGAWDVSNVADMSFMFYDAKSYNKNMDKWDVSKVVSMQKMFFNAKSFDKPIHLTWQGTAASTKQLHLLKDAKAFHEKYSCEDETDGPLTSCTEISAATGKKTGSSKKVSKEPKEPRKEEKEVEVPTQDVPTQDVPAQDVPAQDDKKSVQTKEYDIQAFGKSMTAKLEYDEESGQVKGWIIDENAGKAAMLGQRQRGTWRFFKAADLGMAASGTENNFKSSIVFPTAGAFVVFVALAAYRKQQQQRLLVAGTVIEADDLESQNVATPAQRGSRYGTSA